MAQAKQKPLSSSAARDSAHDGPTGNEAKALSATGKESVGQQSEVMEWVELVLVSLFLLFLAFVALLCCTGECFTVVLLH